jgi:hypothetical protein
VNGPFNFQYSTSRELTSISWLWRISTLQGSTTDTFYNQDDPSIWEKYPTQGSGVPCHVSFGFFSRFFGIRLTEPQIDPQLESTIQTKAWGIHSIITFSIWFFIASYQDITSTIEDFREKHSGTLGDYSRRLNNYSRIAGVPSSRDDSSNLENFRLVELEDAQGLLVEAIKTTRSHLTRLQSTRGACRTDIPGPRDYPTCGLWCKTCVERKAIED